MNSYKSSAHHFIAMQAASFRLNEADKRQAARSPRSSGSSGSGESVRTPKDEVTGPLQFAAPKALRIDTINIPMAIKQMDAQLTPPEQRTFTYAPPARRPLPPIPGEPRCWSSVRANLPHGVRLRDLPIRLHMAISADDERVDEHYENLAKRNGR